MLKRFYSFILLTYLLTQSPHRAREPMTAGTKPRHLTLSATAPIYLSATPKPCMPELILSPYLSLGLPHWSVPLVYSLPL